MRHRERNQRPKKQIKHTIFFDDKTQHNKNVIFPKLICKLQVIATEVITKSSAGISKFILKFIWKFPSSIVTKTLLTNNKQETLLYRALRMTKS